MSRAFRTSLAVLMLAGLPHATTLAQGPAPVQPQTVWSFLGIPQGVRKVHGTLFNRRGKHPRLEQKPPLKALADPANLQSEVPAIKKAAEVKQAEDLKPQKIKAIKYLAKIGCGCYDLDGGITEAIVAATGDCTEDVRLAAVEAIAEAAGGKCCANCGEQCCCKEPVVKRLAEMAYERGDDGCYLESSARVREAAARALAICCPDASPVEIETTPSESLPDQVPEREGPSREGPNDGEAANDATVTYVAPLAERLSHVSHVSDAKQPRRQDPIGALGRLLSPAMTSVAKRDAVAQSGNARGTGREGTKYPHGQNTPATAGKPKLRDGEGVVVGTDPNGGSAHVHFVNRSQKVPSGTRLTVYRPHGPHRHAIGQVVVDQSFSGASHVQALGTTNMEAIRPGDIVAMRVSKVSFLRSVGHRQ